MTDPYGKIASAIAMQEGWFTAGLNTPRPRRLNNPGDLRAAPWLAHANIEGGYWKADHAAMGIGGLYHQIALNVARGMTLRQLVTAWAPATDGNDPAGYLAHVMEWTGIANADEPLWSLLELTKP